MPIWQVQFVLWDTNGNPISTWSASRPELENVLLTVPYANVAKITATTQDVYGLVRSYEIAVGE